jgi:hypothetical protein
MDGGTFVSPGKQEAGLMGFEVRDDVGLVRHLTLALIVPGFVTLLTERLRGGTRS